VSTDRVSLINPATGTSQTLRPLPQPVHDAAGVPVGGGGVVFAGGAATTVDSVQAFGVPRPLVIGHLPQPRSDLSAVTVGDRTYVLGGYTGTSLPTQVLATSAGRSFATAGAVKVPVRYTAAVAQGQSIYLFGGQSAAGGPVGTVQRYDVPTGRTTVVGRLPYAVSGASAGIIDGQLVVAGGRLASGSATGRVLVWNTSTEHARAVGHLPQPEANAASVVLADRLWLLGGEAATPLDTVQVVSARQ
jgi:hypothetical protein